MAKPIKETPVLMGEDAKRFLKHKKESKGKKIDPEKLKKMKESYLMFSPKKD